MVKINNLIDLLAYQVAIKPNHTAFRFLSDGENVSDEVSFFQLEQRTLKMASLLQEEYLRGDRVVLSLSFGIDFIVSFMACIYAGLIPIPAYPPASTHHVYRLTHIINDAEPKLLICDDKSALKLDNLQAMLMLPIKILNINQSLDISISWKQPKIRADDLAFLMYTSGSLSYPKGAMLSHHNLLTNQEMIKRAFAHDESTRFVGWTPLFHDMGLIGNILQPIYLGIECTLLPPTKFIQRPVKWLRAISKYRATTSGAPDFAYALCAKKITEEQKQTLDLSSWKVAYCGAEPIRAETVNNFAKNFISAKLNPKAFFPCYGLAEATLLVSSVEALKGVKTLIIDENSLKKNKLNLTKIKKEYSIVSCGKPFSSQEILIVDPVTEKICVKDKIGEIWIKGDNVIQEYWNKAEVSKSNLQATLGEQGPFLRTGDLGFIYQEELYVTGRIKDLIIVRGKNHYPQDIEYSAENSHPSLNRPGALVFSINNDKKEKVVLVQEVSKINPDEKQALKDAISYQVATNHGLILDDIVLIKKRRLPRTSSGKLQRQLCKKWYLSHGLNKFMIS